MRRYIFWDITPCSPMKLNRRFGGTYCLHLQGGRIIQARNGIKQAVRRDLLVSSLVYPSTLKKRQYSPPKRRLTFTGLHGGISQKIELLKMTVCVCTSMYVCTYVYTRIYVCKYVYVCVCVCVCVCCVTLQP
jgi:hypothetical protein